MTDECVRGQMNDHSKSENDVCRCKCMCKEGNAFINFASTLDSFSRFERTHWMPPSITLVLLRGMPPIEIALDPLHWHTRVLSIDAARASFRHSLLISPFAPHLVAIDAASRDYALSRGGRFLAAKFLVSLTFGS